MGREAFASWTLPCTLNEYWSEKKSRRDKFMQRVGETFIPSSGSCRRLVFLKRAQTLNIHKKYLENRASPPVGKR